MFSIRVENLAGVAFGLIVARLAISGISGDQRFLHVGIFIPLSENLAKLILRNRFVIVRAGDLIALLAESDAIRELNV